MPGRVRGAFLLGLIVVVGCSDAAGAVKSSPLPGSATSIEPEPTTTVTPPPQPSTALAKVEISRTLRRGDRGDDVAYLQQRLTDLRFDPGPIDGVFGGQLEMAVWAYQKLTGRSGDAVDGGVSPEDFLAMQDPMQLEPMEPQENGRHVEVDLIRQVAIIWEAGSPTLITHISTGSGEQYCDAGTCSVAITPAGEYGVTREIDGWRQSDLGLLYNPVYFNGGIALHGAFDVPLRPASHGCVRVPMHIANYLPELLEIGDPVLVFDGVKRPSEYGQQPSPPHTLDAATATSSSTATSSEAEHEHPAVTDGSPVGRAR
ncbi:MAG: L,D-transpeptidase family protein [Acidimicrobiia bacterium]